MAQEKGHVMDEQTMLEPGEEEGADFEDHDMTFQVGRKIRITSSYIVENVKK